MPSRAREAERDDEQQHQRERGQDDRHGSHRRTTHHESSRRSGHSTSEGRRHSSRRESSQQQDAASSGGSSRRHREHGEQKRREATGDRRRSRSPARRLRVSEAESASPSHSRGREVSPPGTTGKRKRDRSKDDNRPPSNRARRDSHSSASDHSRRSPPRNPNSRPSQHTTSKSTQRVPLLPPSISLADPHLHLPRQRSPSPSSDPAYLFHLSLPSSLFPLLRGARSIQLTAYSNLTRLTPVQANAAKGTSAFVQLIGSREAIAECCEAIRRALGDVKEGMNEQQRVDYEGMREWLVESEVDDLGESKEDFVERAKRLAREKEAKGKGKPTEKEQVVEKEPIAAMEPPREVSREEWGPKRQDQGWGSRAARVSVPASQERSARTFDPDCPAPYPPHPPLTSQHDSPSSAAERWGPPWAIRNRRSFMLARKIQQLGTPGFCIIVPVPAVARVIGKRRQTLDRIEMMTNSSIFLDDMDFPPAAYLFGADERRAQLVLREVERVVRDTQEVGSAWRGHLEAMNDADPASDQHPPRPQRPQEVAEHLPPSRPTPLRRPLPPDRPSPPPRRASPPPREASPPSRSTTSRRRSPSPWRPPLPPPPPPPRLASPHGDQDRFASALSPRRSVSPFRPPAPRFSSTIDTDDKPLFSYAAARRRSPSPRPASACHPSRSVSPRPRAMENHKAAYDSDDSDLVIVDPSPDDQGRKKPTASARQSGTTSSRSNLSALGSASSLFEQGKEVKRGDRQEGEGQLWISPASSLGRAEQGGEEESKRAEAEQNGPSEEAMDVVGGEETVEGMSSLDKPTALQTPAKMEVDSDGEEEDEIILAVSPAAKLLKKKDAQEDDQASGGEQRGKEDLIVPNGHLSDESSESSDSDASADESSAPPTTSKSSNLPFTFSFDSISAPARSPQSVPTLSQARASLAQSLATLDALGPAPPPYTPAELASRVEEKKRRKEEKTSRKEERAVRNEERRRRRGWRIVEERVEREKLVVEKLEAEE